MRVFSVVFVAGITALLGAWPLSWAALWATGFCGGEATFVAWWIGSKSRRESAHQPALARLHRELITLSGAVSAYAAIPCFFTPSHGQFGATVGTLISSGMLLIVAAQHSLNKNMFFVTAPAPCVSLILNLFFLGHGLSAWALSLLGVVFIVNARSLQLANAQSYQELVAHQIKAQRALAQSQESEAHYRVLADNQTDVITLWDSKGGRLYVSPATERASGFTVAETLAQAPSAQTHPDDLPDLQQIFSSLRVEDAPRTIEFRSFCKDGSIVWLETTLKRLGNGAGGFISTSRVITERKRLEQKLVDALHDANEASKAKSDFLANMTHELRTPLNAIVGFSGLLREASDLNPGHARQVELVWDASQSLLRTINDVLDFSKLEAGAVELELGAFDPEDLVYSTVSMLSGQASDKGLDVRVETIGLEGKLLGDGARLRQVLTNLISNAVKFTNQGEIVIRASQQNEGANRRLHLSVKDSGIGLAQEQMTKLFCRFSQADASVSRRFGGTGLGLAISKQIIDRMGGEIGVKAAEGRGSTFWFEVSLPLAEETCPVNLDRRPPPQADRPLRLLVVEDNAINRELICAMLGTTDVEIETADDGVKAIEALARSQFDVVFMDVQMPNMDGLAATRHIRAAQDPSAPRLPIIAMTANVLPEQIARCLEAGMDDHVGKPISIAKLFEALARWGGEKPATDHEGEYQTASLNLESVSRRSS